MPPPTTNSPGRLLPGQSQDDTSFESIAIISDVPAPLITDATISRGVITFSQNVSPIPADVWRKLQALSADLHAGFDVRLPRLISWIEVATGQTRAIIVRIGGAS